MQLILMGPQGSGKGTQAAELVRLLGVPHISTGDILRRNMREGTPLGKQAADIVNRGDLVPDDIILAMVRDRLAEPDTSKGFIFDGFPRTLAQAEGLDRLLADMGRGLTAVIDLSVPREVLMERMVGRRVCKQCGATYHVKFNPPRVEGVCDKCGGPLYQREDDQPGPINRRLDAYERETAPLLGYYAERGLVKSIDGTQAMEQVTSDILASLGIAR